MVCCSELRRRRISTASIDVEGHNVTLKFFSASRRLKKINQSVFEFFFGILIKDGGDLKVDANFTKTIKN